MNNSEQIWQEYHDRLHGFIRSRVADPSAADDILQQIFLKIHAKIDTLQETEKIQSWMYQIARNTIIDYYRSHKETKGLPDILESPEEEAHEKTRREIAGCMGPLIEGLPDHYREAITMSEIDGLTQKEVATRQGVSLPGAKARVQRGRKLLKEKLDQCCKIEADRHGNVIDYEPREAGSCACSKCE